MGVGCLVVRMLASKTIDRSFESHFWYCHHWALESKILNSDLLQGDCP